MIAAEARDRLRRFADALIPAGDGMPAAGEVGVADKQLDRVLAARPDLVAPLERALAEADPEDYEGSLERLHTSDLAAHDALLLVIAGGYYTDAGVRKLLGYDGQQPVEVRPEIIPNYVEEGLIEPLLARGPVYRPVEGQTAPLGEARRLTRDNRSSSMSGTLEGTVTSIATARQEWHGQLYSSGWRAPSGGALDVLEKATGEPLATVGLAGAHDVARAAELAAAAQIEWGASSFEERAAILRRAADILEGAAPDVIAWLVRETGEIRARATHEVRISVGEIREAAALAGQPYGELLPTTERGRFSFAQRVPVGVVGAITPWNAPVILGIRVIAPALALGNAVVIKPDAQTPITGGLLLASIFEDAGLPEGVLHALPGAAEAGEALVTDPHTRLISFTGSTATGRRVGELAGRHLKKVSLELGGNNALIVLDDADLEGAASSGSWGSFLHQGQLCFSTGRHLVQESVAGAYAEAITARAEALAVGDPFREDVALGPIINQRQLDRFDAIVQDTVSAGARLRTGGTHERLFYRPTVLDGVEPAMRAFHEEIFGPVAAITTFGSDEEAVELANRTEYGLTAAVYTSSLGRGLDVARAMRTGMVHVNDTTINDQAIAPFGGMGASGNGGRFGSLANWEEFTQWQWCTVRDRPPRFAF